eukprot:1146841-Pelagomonas_calceolata.AAC.7
MRSSRPGYTLQCTVKQRQNDIASSAPTRVCTQRDDHRQRPHADARACMQSDDHILCEPAADEEKCSSHSIQRPGLLCVTSIVTAYASKQKPCKAKNAFFCRARRRMLHWLGYLDQAQTIRHLELAIHWLAQELHTRRRTG